MARGLLLTTVLLSLLTAGLQAKEQILYDFCTSTSAAHVHNIFKGINTPYKFKLYGTDRYLVVAENDQSTRMMNLTLPPDAFNVRTIPVETMDVLFSHFDPSFPLAPSYLSLPSSNISFIELSCTMDYNEVELTSAMKERAASHRGKNNFDLQVFVATGVIPGKSFMFLKGSDSETRDLVLKDAASFCGPKRMESATQRIYKI